MKHLLLVAAFLAAMQPLAAHLNRPNGATILAAILVIAWGWAVIPTTRKPVTPNQLNSQGSGDTRKAAPWNRPRRWERCDPN